MSMDFEKAIDFLDELDLQMSQDLARARYEYNLTNYELSTASENLKTLRELKKFLLKINDTGKPN